MRHYLHADHQGSIVAVADDAGNALAIDKYDEWGVPAAGNSPVGSPPLRFQYTGQVWLPDIGLYYYKARMYSSRLGRFLQTDPVGYKDQMNLYAYVSDDPLNRSDPTGLAQKCGAFKGDAPCPVEYDVRERRENEKHINTIATDGHGGVVIKLDDPTVAHMAPEAKAGVKVHENTHRNDFYENASPESRAKVAAAPAGYLITPMSPIDRVKDEIKAYSAEIAYDQNTLESTKLDPDNRQNLIANMDQAMGQLHQYETELNKLENP